MLRYPEIGIFYTDTQNNYVAIFSERRPYRINTLLPTACCTYACYDRMENQRYVQNKVTRKTKLRVKQSHEQKHGSALTKHSTENFQL